MLFDEKFSLSALRLPDQIRRNRSVYEGFFTDPIVQPMIDLHREFPLRALKKEPIDG
jgi:hypothetical protein